MVFFVILLYIIHLNKLRFDQVSCSGRSGSRWQYWTQDREKVRKPLSRIGLNSQSMDSSHSRAILTGIMFALWRELCNSGWTLIHENFSFIVTCLKPQSKYTDWKQMEVSVMQSSNCCIQSAVCIILTCRSVCVSAWNPLKRNACAMLICTLWL